MCVCSIMHTTCKQTHIESKGQRLQLQSVDSVSNTDYNYFMVGGSLETRPQEGEKRPGEYCLRAQQFLLS